MFSAQPSRTAQYAKADNAAVNKEERLRRLRTEVRDYVRQITDQPLLSADWLRVAQSLHEVRDARDAIARCVHVADRVEGIAMR
jgi:hypothetical protein